MEKMRVTNPRPNEPSAGHRFQSLATAAARPPELPGTEVLAERLKIWGVRFDDPDAVAVTRRMARIRLSVGDQLWLFETAERIAEAEKAKAAWNPKAKATQYLNFCKIVKAAARLTIEVSKVFPPPWTEERARMGRFVGEMAAFMEGVLAATMIVTQNSAVFLASATVTNMKQSRPPKSRLYWELLQDLIWLASAKRAGRMSERSVRRYVEGQRRARSPARAYWRRNFKLIQEAIRLNSPQKPSSSKSIDDLRGPRADRGFSKAQLKAIEAFTEIAQLYLQASDALDFSRGPKAAKKRS